MTRPLPDPESIYEEHVASLPSDAKMRLVALIVERVAAGEAPAGARLVELDGLGREVWDGVDPDEHVRRLRDEWEGRL